MPKNQFRAIPGTHSRTLKEHLRTTFSLNKIFGKKRKSYNVKRLEAEARKIVIKQLKLPKGVEQKLEKAQKQREIIDHAREQLQKQHGVEKRFAQKLLDNGMKELEELAVLQKERGVPDGEIIGQLQVIYHLFYYLRRQTMVNTQKLEPAFGQRTVSMIEEVHVKHLAELLGKKFNRYKNAVESAYSYIKKLTGRLD